MASVSKVFVVMLPGLHAQGVGREERESLASQYRFLVKMIAKRKDSVLLGLYFDSRSSKKYLGFDLDEHAKKMLGKRFVEGTGCETACKSFAGLLEKNSKIKVFGFGECLNLCAKKNKELVAAGLMSMGFSATESSSVPLWVGVIGKKKNSIFEEKVFYSNKKSFRKAVVNSRRLNRSTKKKNGIPKAR